MKNSKCFNMLSLVSITVLLLCLAAGIFYYSELVKNKISDIGSSNLQKSKSIYKTFSNDLFSFTYPSEGWGLSIDNSYGDFTLQTDYYEDGPMGVEKGSYINFSKFDTAAYKNIDDQIKSYKAKGMISKLENITVDGQSAYKYPCYEYCTYTVLFKKDNAEYSIVFASMDVKNQAVFENIIKTLKIK